MNSLFVDTSPMFARQINQLPPFHTSFFWPSGYEQFASQQVDWESLEYLPELVKSLTPSIVPVLIDGDGNCLLRAISFSLWGLQDYHEGLRIALCDELRSHLDWYKKSSSTIESFDWDKALEEAEREGDYLGFTHVFALSNILQRAIVVYASDDDVAQYGQQESGVAGTFLPTRAGVFECFTKPAILLTWSSKKKNHFLPLIVFEGTSVQDKLPNSIPEVAFQKTIENIEEVRYQLWMLFELDFSNPPERIEQMRDSMMLSDDSSSFSRNAGIGQSVSIGNQVATNLGPLDRLLALNPGNSLLQTLAQASMLRERELQNQNRIMVKVYYRDSIRTVDLNNLDHLKQQLGKTMQIKLVTFYANKLKHADITRKSNHHELFSVQSTHEQYIPLGRIRYPYFPHIKQLPYKRADDIRKALGFITQKSGIQFSPAQIKDLDELVGILASATMEDREFSNSQLQLISYMLSVGQTKSIFAVLDVVRLMILHPQAIKYFASRMGSVSNPENLLTHLLKHLSNLAKMDEKTRKSVYQLAFMLLTNIFQSESFFPYLSQYASTIMVVIDQAITLTFLDAQPNYDLTNRCSKIVACLPNVMEHSSRVNKFQLVYLIVKFLGKIHGSRDNYLESASNLICALASLIYSDWNVQGLLLDVHIRWPLRDAREHANTLDHADSNYEKLICILDNLEDLLARPVFVPKTVLVAQTQRAY